MSDILALAIKQVLADDDVKKAVLDYFKSMTKEEWRKIYRRQSDELRYIFEEVDSFTGAKNTFRPLRMYVEADYNERGSVGRLFVTLRHDSYFDPIRYHGDDYFYYGKESPFVIAEEAVMASHPAEVVDYIFASWDKWLDEFCTRTVPTNEPENAHG